MRNEDNTTVIHSFNRDACAAVKAEARELLANLAKHRGLTLQLAAGTFDEGSFQFKVTFEATPADGVPASFKRLAPDFGLEGQYGRTFEQNGKTFAVIGINPRRRTYPVSAREMASGKQYKFGTSTVIALLGASTDGKTGAAK